MSPTSTTPTTPPTTRPLTDLPLEVQTMVAQVLPFKDYANCALVCRTWNLIFTPRIWHTIKPRRQYTGLKPGDYAYHYHFSLAAARYSALRNNGHFVRHLKLDFDQTYLQSILMSSPAVFPLLESIEFQDIHSDDILADLLERATGGLKSIVLHDNERRLLVGPKSAEVLVRKHAPTLEVLRVRSIRRFPSTCIQQLLMNAPRLKELYLLPHERSDNDAGDGFLDANDVGPFEKEEEKNEDKEQEGENGWACRNLETFACQIGGIPRPDLLVSTSALTTTNNNNNTSKHFLQGIVTKSLTLQRRVYTQLGRLTNLKSLQLNTCHDTKQNDCLAMTLESGLDLMKDLKQLKDLGLTPLRCQPLLLTSIGCRMSLHQSTRHRAVDPGESQENAHDKSIDMLQDTTMLGPHETDHATSLVSNLTSLSDRSEFYTKIDGGKQPDLK
ncbi:MAG: hypothetical protein J3R72DRAFT_484544 [Linnemannia gamsii]|nr:MAG: hypothetical protein J3R72DRAFT_484544 [Linnemannia gamsii]